MASLKFKHFGSTEALRSVSSQSLLGLLGQHRDYFESQGVSLDVTADGNLDYDALVSIFAAPDANMPTGLIDALYHIEEMSTPETMDDLLREAEERDLGIDFSDDCTPMDVALRMWLSARTLLEHKHAEQILLKPRTFVYYQSENRAADDRMPALADAVPALETDLDAWFVSKKRGPGTRVFPFEKSDGLWFLIRHGDVFKREGSLVNGESTSISYRPEKHDVVVYNPSAGELKIKADRPADREQYRQVFGLHLFGNTEHFPDAANYTLEPLRTKGRTSISCSDILGMEEVVLKEIQFAHDDPMNVRETLRAEDVFAVIEAGLAEMPPNARISSATFAIKFADSKRPRMVTIQPSNVARYRRDGDGCLIDEWLQRRGFILAQEHDPDEEPDAALAGV